MDPQQRLLLEVTYRALENGYLVHVLVFNQELTNLQLEYLWDKFQDPEPLCSQDVLRMTTRLSTRRILMTPQVMPLLVLLQH